MSSGGQIVTKLPHKSLCFQIVSMESKRKVDHNGSGVDKNREGWYVSDIR